MFGKRRRESLCASNIATEENKMTTVLRIRPTAGIDDYDDNYLRINQFDSEVTLIPPEFRPGAPAEKFKFDQILGPEVQQPEVFKNTVNNLVKAAFDGKNACLFAYGASGSGKTHTMMGKPSDPGVIPRTLELLFKAVGGQIDENEQLIATGSCSIREGTKSELKENEKARLEVRQLAKGASSKKGPRRSITSVPDEPFQQRLDDVDFEIDNDSTYVIYASFYELYNEKVYDLLVPMPKDKKRVALSVKMDHKGAYVNKLRQIRINSPHEALTLLKAGQQGLTTGATRLNSDSSRSHCLFTLRIARKVNKHAFQVSNLAFCDLAGTERGKKLGRADQKLLSESKTINKSLMQLRLVITDLQGLQKNGNKVVSFRNSKLTQLMEPYLVGHSMTCIMIAVSNDPEIYDDTQRSLEFASTAQQIQMGLDRHGKKLKESAKLNLSRVPSPEEEIEDTMHQDEHEIDDPYGVGTDFSDWTKQDVIDDLVYYMHFVKDREQCIQRMKIEWQKDEQEWNEYKVSYEERIEDLKILRHNARATGTNDLIDAEERYSKKLKGLNTVIEDLKKKLSKAAGTEKLDELTAENISLQEKIDSLNSQIELDNQQIIDLERRKNDELDAKISEITSLKAAADSHQLTVSDLKCTISALREELDAERGPGPMSPISESTHVFEPNNTRQLFRDSLPAASSHKINDLEIENKQLLEDNDSLRHQIEIGKEMLSNLRREKSELRAALEKTQDEDVTSELQEQVQQYASNLSSMKEQYQSLEIQLEEVRQDKNSLAEKLELQIDQLSRFESECDELRRSAEQLKERIHGVERCLETSEKEKLEAQKALELFKTKSESLQSDSERMKELNQELTTLRSDFSTHLEKSKELEQKLSEKIITIDLQSEKIDELQHELNNERISKDHEIASLAGDLEKLKVSQKASEEASESDKQELAKLKDAVSSLTSEIAAKEVTIKKLEDELESNSSSKSDALEKAKNDLLAAEESSKADLEKANGDLKLAEEELKHAQEDLKQLKETSDAELVRVKQIMEEEIEELQSVVATLREKAEAEKSPPSDSEEVEKLQEEIDELKEALKDKNFRSKLRKQLDKEKEESASLRKKLAKMEQQLQEKEATIERSLTSSSIVKGEPSSIEQSSTEDSKVKDEPDEEWVQPKPQTPLQRIKNKLTGSTRKKRQLAPHSPDAMENSPAAAEVPARRTRRQRK